MSSQLLGAVVCEALYTLSPVVGQRVGWLYPESLDEAAPSCQQPQLCACSTLASCAPARWPVSPVALCISLFAVGGGGGLGPCLLLHHRTSGNEGPSQPRIPVCHFEFLSAPPLFRSSRASVPISLNGTLILCCSDVWGWLQTTPEEVAVIHE